TAWRWPMIDWFLYYIGCMFGFQKVKSYLALKFYNHGAWCDTIAREIVGKSKGKVGKTTSVGIKLCTEPYWKKAIRAYQRAIRLKPDYAEAHNDLGVAYGELGRWHEALEACQQATRLQPNDARAHYNLGAAYGNLGRIQEAVAACEQAIRLQPDSAT